ncbi:hypothetical protein AINA4_01490 [Aurantimicrobium sp. INA4]|nr:hypothetical protein AINA4_01490 [Aurantimicrobium sp. INA4]
MPSLAVVVVTGLPLLRMGFPEESNKVTVTPGMAVPEVPPPASPARPEIEVVQKPNDGACTVRFRDAEVSVVVTPPNTEVPNAPTVVAKSGKEDMGPRPLGHGYTAVTLVHSSGASPTALRTAVAVVIEPVIPLNATLNVGVVPVSTVLNELKSRGLLSESGTSTQPAMTVFDEFLIVSFAEVNDPDPALLSMNETQDRTCCEPLLHDIRGTMTLPANVAVVGERAEQPL